MSNPHSFYRFQPAWNAGFYPDNQITSNLLNDLHVAISAWLPTYWPGLTISQLKAGVTQFIQTYNEFPNFGEFVLTLNKIADTPNWEYTINIFNADLAVTDSSQIVTISGFFNPTTQIVVSAAVYSFTVGAYSGAFDASPIPVEAEVANSLTIAEQYGSAMFPLTYLYNPSTNIATSGLARGKNWTVNTNGDPTRLPVNSQPLLNARRFTLPALTGDEKFIVTFLEKLINSSLVDDSYLSIEADYNSFVMPDGWTKSWDFDAGTYDRIQVSCTDSDSGNVFLIVGRNDAGWLWQRFVRIGGSTPAFDFLGYYSDTTPLPYNSSSASSYLFFDEYYEFDFCDFTEGCYVSPEFYAMPAIPGDTWQFNVPMEEANLTGLTSVNVGIFQEDGGFLHQIGAAERNCCFEAYMPYVVVDGATPAFDDWVSFVDTYLVSSPLQFFFSNQTTNYSGLSAGTETGDELGAIAATLPAGTVTTYDKQDFIDAVAALSWPAGIEVTGDIVNFSGSEVVLLRFCNYLASEYAAIQAKSLAGELPVYLNYIKALCCEPTQFQASCTIPAVPTGCYRLGLYNIQETGGSNTCQLTFEYIIDSPEAYVDEINSYSPKFLAFALYDGAELSQIYTEQIPSTEPPATGFDLAQIIDFANSIPGMVATYDEETAYLTYNWTVTVPCNQEFSFRNLILNTDDSILDLLFSTESQLCSCEVVDLNAYSLYSLSNIINVDASDCFSTMLEFWGNNNSIAQGFEYSNDWKQRVRLGINGGGAKPIIEENLYRQSNGVHKRPQNKQDLSVDLHTDFLDEETQLALVDATRHPYLVWSGKPIFVKGDIEVATIQDFTTQSSFETLSQVKFQALIQGFQPKNSSCLTC